MSGVDHDALRATLAAAVEALGGSERLGQIAMAEAVAESMAAPGRRHLLVQAGTGTGKSLGYLVPALRHDKRVVVATATLALQHQLVERDLPRLTKAVDGRTGVDTSYAVLKGRSNYACLHRIREGVPDEQGELIKAEAALGALGKKVLELREWAEGEAEDGGSGEKDAAPRHTDREWRQVSVTARECLGSTRCPFGEECFAERAREKAQRSHLIVTNHSLLAIDAIEGVPMIPDYDVVVIDEAHELTARVTQAATDELWASEIERAARRSARHTKSDGRPGRRPRGRRIRAAGRDRGGEAGPVRRRARRPRRRARAGARRGPGAGQRFPQGRRHRRRRRRAHPGQGQRAGALRDRRPDGRQRRLRRAVADRGHRPAATPALRRPAPGVGPAARQAALREDRGDDVRDPDARRRLHLRRHLGRPQALRARRHPAKCRGWPREVDGSPDEVSENDAEPWVGLDVGSPFDYGTQSILYVARHLPQPGRDGLVAAQLDEITELVDAADGRTLGLFSSRRAAETAAEYVREKLPHLTTLAQGDAQLPELARQFVEDPHTNLFGTLGLWQGLDVPGDTCQLVIIDRIPFPRPDDPLMSARQRAADQAGGNGFMQVAATHAALLLAQGSGRLIRTHADKGVVAVLDPRLVTARYGSFLKASLPPMWTTTDPAVVRKALTRLSGCGLTVERCAPARTRLPG